jgi:hypothetical protein
MDAIREWLVTLGGDPDELYPHLALLRRVEPEQLEARLGPAGLQRLAAQATAECAAQRTRLLRLMRAGGLQHDAPEFLVQAEALERETPLD